MVGAALALSVALVVAGGAFALLRGAQEPRSSTVTDPRVDAIGARLTEVEVAVKGLPSLWESERQRAEDANDAAKRRNSSARAALSAARRARPDDDEDDDDEGDDDLEDDDVLELDARRGGGGGVQQLPTPVGPDPEDDLTKRAVAAGWSPFI